MKLDDENINIRLRIAPDPGEHFLAYSEQPDFVRINRSLPQLSILKDKHSGMLKVQDHKNTHQSP